MSYIDTLNHKVLGEIAYLPVYLLEDDDLGEGNEFNSPKGTILLGGGGGEHPALAIKNLDVVILNALLNKFYELKPEDLKATEFLKLQRELGIYGFENKIYDILDDINKKDKIEYDFYNVLQFNCWTMNDYAKLVNWRNENDKREFYSTEEWLNVVIGEFIIDNCNDLNKFQDLINEYNEIKDILENQDKELSFL